MKRILLIAASAFFIQICYAQTDSVYFGQTPPGDKADTFAPGIISKAVRLENKIIFSPDGNECYISVYNGTSNAIYFTKCVNNTWSEQVEASFSVNQNVGSPYIKADGNKLYFDKYSSDFSTSDICMVDRITGGWGNPQYLPSPVNSGTIDGDFIETADSTVYISSTRSGGFGGYGDIWCIQQSPDQTLKAKLLGSPISTAATEFAPCLPKDGSYLIFTSDRPGGTGYQNLYICFNKGNNQWTAPIDMERSGAKINIPKQHQTYPSLSPDEKYLFFARHNPNPATIEDIYWVSTHIIDTLKKIAMPNVSVEKIVEQDVMLFPNPTTGQLTISFGTSPVKEAIIEVYNTES